MGKALKKDSEKDLKYELKKANQKIKRLESDKKSLKNGLKQSEIERARLLGIINKGAEQKKNNRRENIDERAELEMQIFVRMAEKVLSWDTRNKEAFERGDKYLCDEHTLDNAMFDTSNLLLNINPRTGRRLDAQDKQILLTGFGGAKTYYKEGPGDVGALYQWYWKAMSDYKDWKSFNPYVTEDELVEEAYKRGMKILSKYVDSIT